MSWQRSGSRSRGGRWRGGSRGPSKRRPLEWECAQLIDRIALGPGLCDQTVLITRDEFDEEYSDSTLVRIRGLLHLTMNTALITQGAQGAAGIIEVEGVHDIDAIPYCPLSDCDASWLWHSYWALDGIASVPGAEGGSKINSVQIEIDAKSQRRLEAGDTSLWIAVESDVVSDEAVVYWWGVRMLLAEK